MTDKPLEIRTFKFPDSLCDYLGRVVIEAAAKALADDMRKNGQLHAGLVAPDPKRPGRFLIILGNTRHRACQIAELDFRAEVLPEMPPERERIQMQVSENLKRRSLSGFERAQYIADYKTTLPPDTTWAEVAEGLGMKEATVLLHVAPKRIPENLRPSCDGLGLTVLCLIGRIPKITDMPKVIEFAQTGATKDQVERFIKKLAKTVGRKNSKLAGKVEGLDFSHEVKPTETADHVAERLEKLAKKFRKVGDAPAHTLSYLLA